MAEALFSGVNQIAFASVDPKKLASFYTETLGLSYLFETGGMHFLDAGGGVRLMIGPCYGGREVGGGDVMVYFEPKEWRDAIAKLEAAGVDFVDGGMELMKEAGRTYALRAFRDPEGHQVALLGWRAD
ncbi:MAG: VOC family protein [Hyphomonadaceae bacterium]|nr:VOC family protein [Hyphomonadaceae bacterium]